MKKIFLILLMITGFVQAQNPALISLSNIEPVVVPLCDFTNGVVDQNYTINPTVIGDARGNQLTMSEDGYIQTVSVWHDGTEIVSKLTVAIYSDTGSDEPGQLLSQSYSQSHIYPGWNTLSLDSEIFISSGSKYWAIAVGDGLTMKYETNAAANRVRSTYQAETYDGIFPQTFDVLDVAQYDYAIHSNYTCQPSIPNELKFWTNSRSSDWDMYTTTKSGSVLTWSAVNKDGTDYGSQNVNKPSFDFSGNTDQEDIEITVTSSDGWTGLTQLDFWTPNDPDDGGSQIKGGDIRAASSLTFLNTRYSKFDHLDLSNQSNLTQFHVRGKGQFAGGVDLSAMTNLNILWMDGCDAIGLADLDISANPLLNEIRLFDMYNGSMSTSNLDQYIIQLDANGISNGEIVFLYDTPTPTLSLGSYNAYQNLISKGWTIDIDPMTVDPPNYAAYDFDGSTNSYFNTNFDLNGLTDHTIIVVGTMETDGEEHTMLGSSSNANWYWRRHSGGNLWVTIIDAAANKTETSRAWTYNDGYNQFAYKYDATQGAQIFANGVSLGSYYDTDFTGFTTAQNMYIGKRYGNSSSIIKGKIKEIQIYDRALTDQELTDINTNSNNIPSGLVVHFAGQKTASTWVDEVSGYVATNAGGVGFSDLTGQDYSLAGATHDPLMMYDPSSVTGTATETIEVANGMFWVGPSGTPYQYTFTDGDITTMVYDNKSGSVTQSRNLLHWNEDGTDLYTANFAENVYLSGANYDPPFDITGSNSYVGQVFDLTTYDSDGRGYAYNQDGTKFWMLGVINTTIFEFDLVPAYTGATSVTLAGSLDVSSQANLFAGMDLSPDGTFLIYGNRGDDSIDSWKLSTPGTIVDGATFDVKMDLDDVSTTIYQVKYSENGNHIYWLDTSQELIKQLDLNNVREHNLLTNGTFDSATDWTLNTGWTISAGTAKHDGTSGTTYIRELAGTVYGSGETYRIEFDVISNTGTGANNVQFGDSGETISSTHLDPGHHVFVHTLTTAKSRWLIYGRTGSAIEIDNVTVTKQ